MMRTIFILTAATYLTTQTVAIAEDNESLLKPVYHGAFTKDAEANTYAFDGRRPSDLNIRFRSICSFGPMCTDRIVTGTVPEGTAPGYRGAVTGNSEKDTYAF